MLPPSNTSPKNPESHYSESETWAIEKPDVEKINLYFGVLTEDIVKFSIFPCFFKGLNEFKNSNLKNRDLKSLACVSKSFYFLVKKRCVEWENEHKKLQSQNKRVELQNRTVQGMFDHIVNNKYAVACFCFSQDLKDFKYLNDSTLELLLEKSRAIEHLVLRCGFPPTPFLVNISVFPLACVTLKTLTIRVCHTLKSLPAGMSALTHLDCWECTSLTSLPHGMRALTHLDCSGCIGLKGLPNDLFALTKLTCFNCASLTSLSDGMTALKKLTCARCTSLKELPNDLIALTTLNCGECTDLTGLPDSMIALTTLFCWNCTSLTSLPGGMTALTIFYCSGCTGLTGLPDGMIALTHLDCWGCTSLTSLPDGMIALTRFYCARNTGLMNLPDDFFYLKVKNFSRTEAFGTRRPW